MIYDIKSSQIRYSLLLVAMYVSSLLYLENVLDTPSTTDCLISFVVQVEIRDTLEFSPMQLFEGGTEYGSQTPMTLRSRSQWGLPPIPAMPMIVRRALSLIKKVHQPEHVSTKLNRIYMWLKCCGRED